MQSPSVSGGFGRLYLSSGCFRVARLVFLYCIFGCCLLRHFPLECHPPHGEAQRDKLCIHLSLAWRAEIRATDQTSQNLDLKALHLMHSDHVDQHKSDNAIQQISESNTCLVTKCFMKEPAKKPKQACAYVLEFMLNV
jgi:hypothetical protein